MKLLITGTILLFCSLSFGQNAYLDFSNLYGNTNLGKYKVSVKFSDHLAQSKALIQESYRQDDGEVFCSTSAEFKIGEMMITVNDLQTGWKKSIQQDVIATLKHKSENETCVSDLSEILGEQTLTVYLVALEPIELPVIAPFDYEKVKLSLAPYNGMIQFSTFVSQVDNKLMIQSQNLLSHKNLQSLNPLNNELQYSVIATKDSTLLSLGNGAVSF